MKHKLLTIVLHCNCRSRRHYFVARAPCCAPSRFKFLLLPY